jgi:hypothetical protein
MEMDGPKAATALHGPLGITYYPKRKANMIADYLENLFTSHDLCDENMNDGWKLDSKFCSYL